MIVVYYVLLVQNQYLFIHDAVLEYLTCGDTQISAGDLQRLLKEMKEKTSYGITGFQNQFSVSLHNPHSHSMYIFGIHILHCRLWSK